MSEPNDNTRPMVVCAITGTGPSMGFTDNVHGECVWCKIPIHWRPHMPEGDHICVRCFSSNLKDLGGQIEVTEKTVQELVEHLIMQAAPNDTNRPN